MDAASPEREKTFADNCGFVREALSDLAGETLMHHRAYQNACRVINFDTLLSPHLTATDLSNTLIGDKAAVVRPPFDHFAKDFMDVDLPNQLGSSFDVPIFFFSGRHDYQTPVTLSDQWFSEIQAPHKELIHFEESGHFIVNEEPGKVLLALANNVLPYAQSNTQDLQTKKSKMEAITAHG